LRIYGNLLQQNVTAGSAPSLNLTVNTGNNHITNTGFTYDAAGNLTADGTHTYAYNGFNKLASLDSTAATYSYAVDDLRNRKDVGSSYTEYLRVSGNVIAERNSTGDWSDYIFLGSKRIARAEDFDRALRVYGTNASTGQTTSFYVANAGGLNNYTIRSGDKLYLVQYQNSGSHGGMVLGFTDTTTSRNTVRDLEGYYLNDDATQTSYHFRTVDLSSLAGKVINSVAFYEETDTASGAWAMTFEHVSVVSTDGTVHPIYTGQTTSPVSSISQSGGVSGTGSTVDTNRGHGTTPTLTTTYFHSDHIGSSRMLTSGNAYPIWQATYLPFGYEYNRQISIDHYKFTGYEHDDESGLENANDRMFSSQLARFTSLDPLSGTRINPQTLNKYTYGLNNPLKYSDPSGAEFLDDMDDWGGGGGCFFCDTFDGGDGGGGGGDFVDPIANLINSFDNTLSDLSALWSNVTAPPLTDGVNYTITTNVNWDTVTGQTWTTTSVPSSFLCGNVDAICSGTTGQVIQETGTFPATDLGAGLPFVAASEGIALVGAATDAAAGGVTTVVPALQLMHSAETITSTESYSYWSTQPNDVIIDSLKPGSTEPLTVDSSGTVWNGNTRTYILQERGVDVNSIPRTPYTPVFNDPLEPPSDVPH
jgi:RHS repeat-associated protein